MPLLCAAAISSAFGGTPSVASAKLTHPAGVLVWVVVALSTSVLTVGIIEGIAEATALVTKIFSGALSDPLGKRKFLAVLGFGLAGFTKPIFPLASTVEWLMVARFVIQSSPHDVGGWSVVPTIPAVPSVNRHNGAQCQLLSWAHATSEAEGDYSISSLVRTCRAALGPVCWVTHTRRWTCGGAHLLHTSSVS